MKNTSFPSYPQFFDKMKHSVMSLMPGGGDKPNKREIVRHHHHHHSSPPQQHQQQQQQQQQQPSGIASRNRQPYQVRRCEEIMWGKASGS